MEIDVCFPEIQSIDHSLNMKYFSFTKWLILTFLCCYITTHNQNLFNGVSVKQERNARVIFYFTPIIKQEKSELV